MATSVIPQDLFRTRIVALRINGTTDEYGKVSVPYVSPSSRAFVLSNISHQWDKPYSITVEAVGDEHVHFRVRNMGDNVAIMNTAINTDVCVIFV